MIWIMWWVWVILGCAALFLIVISLWLVMAGHRSENETNRERLKRKRK